MDIDVLLRPTRLRVVTRLPLDTARLLPAIPHLLPAMEPLPTPLRYDRHAFYAHPLKQGYPQQGSYPPPQQQGYPPVCPVDASAVAHRRRLAPRPLSRRCPGLVRRALSLAGLPSSTRPGPMPGEVWIYQDRDFRGQVWKISMVPFPALLSSTLTRCRTPLTCARSAATIR